MRYTDEAAHGVQYDHRVVDVHLTDEVLTVALAGKPWPHQSEVLTLKWTHIDFNHKCLRLPDSKTGYKIVPLGAPALVLLSEITRTEGNPYVFPGENPGGHFVGVPKIWNKIRKTVDLNDVSLHSFRHGYATIGVGSGMSLPLIGGILGHSSEAMTARYGHLTDDPLKNAADRISGNIAAALEGKEKPENVVQIRSGG